MLARVWILALIAVPASAACWPSVRAEDGADYGVPGRLALPYACGSAFRITWTPDQHWAYGKATGIAYDFGLPEGEPVVAPAAGTAYFLRDDRPLETNLGNYVDLVVEGGWLVRMAHLRDEQSGQRELRAGELLGYAGRSGVTEAHLHVELLARAGHRWVCPESDRLGMIFGQSVADLVEGADLANNRCVPSLWMAGEARLDSAAQTLAFGESGRLLLPITNPGYEPTMVDQVAVSLRAPDGALHTVVANGLWQVGGQAQRALTVEIQPDEAGEWQVDGAALAAGGSSWHVDAAGAFTVGAPPVTLVGLSMPPLFEVGEQVRAEAWLQNTSPRDVDLDGLLVTGRSAGNEAWEASASYRLTVPAGGYRRVVLESTSVPQRVGEWRAERVDCLLGARRLVLARLAQEFRVEGAELGIGAVEPSPAPDAPGLLLLVTNVGTVALEPERLLLWGEGTGGALHVSLPGDVLGRLEPGESHRVIVPADAYGAEPDWQLEAAGVWCAGRYLPLRLPPHLGYDEPAVPAEHEEGVAGEPF